MSRWRMKSVHYLIGHIVLSPAACREGHYPAIDVLATLSRVFQSLPAMSTSTGGDIATVPGAYREVELLIRIGEYHEELIPILTKPLMPIRIFAHFATK